jgi:RNA polymerase sigma factor (TIGR02999 family)
MDPTPKPLGELMQTEASAGSLSTGVLLPLIYDELRQLAHRALAGEAKGITLHTTALVHEAYVRLGADPSAKWENKKHYFFAAATAMRRILVDHARARKAAKRGGGFERIPLEEVGIEEAKSPIDWLALDSALTALEAQDADLAQLVGLRYFAGLSVEQAAAALGSSASTVAREWRLARAFLERHIRERAAREEEGGGTG